MQNTIDHNKANRQKWDRRSATYDKRRFNYFRYMQKRAIGKMGLHEPVNFLDLGCGTGWAVCYAARKLHENGTFAGIDISGGMIDRAGKNAAHLKNMVFREGSAEALPFEADFFDKILCTNSFHHYKNPLTALKEVRRVLKPGGELYILDMTADDFLTRRINKLFSHREPEHVKFYSTAEYRSMFSGTGLTHRMSKTMNYPLRLHVASKEK
jgi:ubiquinone/menaquinone biosynthesis C-methylase UbiE